MAKKILITGASSGIGRATALALSSHGYSLVLAARREDRLMALAAECLAAGAVAAVPVPCDVREPSHVERAASALADLPDSLEACLLNNAGYAEFLSVANVSPQSMVDQINVNLTGAMLIAQAILPQMLAAKRGRIINILSITAELVFPNSAAYSAAKAGLRQFGKVLQQEVRREGILVTNVLPGATDTEIWDNAGAGGPKRSDMIPETSIAKTLAWIFEQGPEMAIDEITLMPPRGVL